MSGGMTCAPTVATDAGGASDSQALAGLKVLAVEDEGMLLMALEDMLSDLGCEVVATAATVSEALAAVESKEFRLAILDVSLGKEKIDPVAQAVAAKRVPVVFATGHDVSEVARRFGPDCAVTEKPYTSNSLKRAVTRALQLRPI